jgi:hypothetical protein
MCSPSTEEMTNGRFSSTAAPRAIPAATAASQDPGVPAGVRILDLARDVLLVRRESLIDKNAGCGSGTASGEGRCREASPRPCCAILLSSCGKLWARKCFCGSEPPRTRDKFSGFPILFHAFALGCGLECVHQLRSKCAKVV